MTRTEHLGVGSGWVLRLVVRQDKPILFAHGAEGGWRRIEQADATDRAWLRASKWTPPLPEGVRL